MFIRKLFLHNKWMGAGFAIFAVLTLFFNYKTAQTTPFFVWSMYSKPVYDSVFVFERVYYNGKLLEINAAARQPTQIMVNGQKGLYMNLLHNNQLDPFAGYYGETLGKRSAVFRRMIPDVTNDSVAGSRFPNWFFRYLSSITGEEIDSVSVYQMKVKFNREGLPQILDSSLSLKLYGGK